MPKRRHDMYIQWRAHKGYSRNTTSPSVARAMVEAEHHRRASTGVVRRCQASAGVDRRGQAASTCRWASPCRQSGGSVGQTRGGAGPRPHAWWRRHHGNPVVAQTPWCRSPEITRNQPAVTPNNRPTIRRAALVVR